MAGDIVSVGFDGILEPASPSLQNCIKFSSSGRLFSVLCDFGVVCICELTEIGDSFKVVLVKRLAYSKGELLEGHAWSSDDQIFAVAGCKIYLSKVCQGFSSLYTIPLYHMPKDISLILSDCSSVQKVYSLAVAGPNGVELYQMELADSFKMGCSSSLHSDLAIALVEFSPDKQYLAVAALDGHFGIWTVSSLDTDQKEFWYVHLKTVRITSMEFSPDSSMVAVAGWEGSWHVYRKTVQNERLTWKEFHHGTSIDRVSGDLPGSLISWSPDNRFVRITQCDDKISCLSMFDTQTSVTTGIPLDGIVKGIASSRQMSGDYSLCFLRSKQCFAVKWPITQPASVKTTSSHEQETRLLFQESLEGSLLVERSVQGGVTLQWKRTPQESLALLKKITKRVSEITEGYPSSKMERCGPNVRETIIDSEAVKQESRSVQCSQDEFLRADVLKQDEDSVKSLADCRHGNTSRNVIKSVKVSENKDLCSVRLKTNGQLLEKNGDTHEQDISRNIGQISNVPTVSEKDALGCAESFLDSSGSSTKELDVESNGKSSVTSRYSNDVLSIEAPFLNPRLLQKSGTESLSPVTNNTVKLLISSSYVIVAILPLMAYVYNHEKKEWKSLLFPCAVDNCCITQDKYLVLLTNEGGLKIWCLQSMTMLYCSNDLVCGTKSDFERCIMSGNPFEPQCSILKLDKTGGGEVMHIVFQPNDGGSRVSVKRLLVCYPGLVSHSCASHLCGSVGHLIIFKQSQYSEDGDTKLSQEYKGSSLEKWIVVVPELHISRTFLEESKFSLEQFIIRYHSALNQLDNLATI
ncbi:hypothetical protein ACROYT_G040863 [Oculina patagonica]